MISKLQPNGFRFFAALLIAISTFSVVTNEASAKLLQDENNVQDKSDDPVNELKPAAPQKVDIKPVARDEEIEQRLKEILDATKWFKNAKVEVNDGVVFLTGIANESEYKTWASDLANNTQDVAAVVNRMSIAEKSIWDFSETFGELRDFRNGAIQAMPLIFFGLAVLVATWYLTRLAGYVANRMLGNQIPNSLLRWVATRAIMLPIFIFGVYLILRVSGLTQLALTVLGGTGIIGLIIGIAFQDIAENFLASILISIQKPFRIGDLINVDGREGIVQRVTTRGTTLLTVQGNHVQIPNSKIYKTTIENFTANPLRRLTFDVGIGYDDPSSQAQQIILDKLKEHLATLADPGPRVLIESLGASTVNLRAFFWIDATKNDWQSVRSSCMRVAKQALMQSKISLPDEAREVIFPKGVPLVINNRELLHSLTNNGTAPRGDRENADSVPAGDRQPVAQDPSLQPIEHAASEAEGNMESEIEGLKRQAKNSWLPGEGEEVLVGSESEESENPDSKS